MRDEMLGVGEVRLHVVSEGAGPPVLLLHGFPEDGWKWRRQRAALAGAGFTAIAPDLRGYGRSDRPRGVRSYLVDKLLADIDGLIDALGHERVFLVGHDWGGILAWAFTARRPERVRKLVILNAPHPTLFMRRQLWRPHQLARSWYMFFFVLPSLPERWSLAPGHMRARLQQLAARKEAISDDVVAHYESNARQPGAMTAMINYYRAALLSPQPALPRITVPTKIIWGEDDPVLGPELLDGLERYVDDPTVHRVRGAGHWVDLEAADEVNRELIAFFGATS